MGMGWDSLDIFNMVSSGSGANWGQVETLFLALGQGYDRTRQSNFWQGRDYGHIQHGLGVLCKVIIAFISVPTN